MEAKSESLSPQQKAPPRTSLDIPDTQDPIRVAPGGDGGGADSTPRAAKEVAFDLSYSTHLGAPGVHETTNDTPNYSLVHGL